MAVARTCGWVFLAVAMSSDAGPASLSHVVTAADFINHAIISERELKIGVNNLLATGLLAATTSGRLALTPDGQTLHRRLSTTRSVHTQWERFVAEWEPPAHSYQGWTPAPGELEAAVAEYIARSPSAS